MLGVCLCDYIYAVPSPSVKYDLELIVNSDSEVYPPSDDSILLIESLDIREGERMLEIGCGSGIVSMHCVLNGGIVTCGDISKRAVALTKRNMQANSISAVVLETDLFSNIREKFDTIIFNLPYLPVKEEGNLALAWSGGADGIGPLPGLISGAHDHLLPGGRIVIVVSSLMDQKALDLILKGLEVKVLSELPLFFEKLRVLEISL